MWKQVVAVLSIKLIEFITCKYVVLNVETVVKAKKTSTMNKL